MRRSALRPVRHTMYEDMRTVCERAGVGVGERGGVGTRQWGGEGGASRCAMTACRLQARALWRSRAPEGWRRCWRHESEHRARAAHSVYGADSLAGRGTKAARALVAACRLHGAASIPRPAFRGVSATSGFGEESRSDGSATCLRTFPVKLPIRIFGCSWENGVLRHAVSESVIEVRNLIKENGGGARKL